MRSTEIFEIMEGIKADDVWLPKHPISGYTEIRYHIIFDIQMDRNFTQKQDL